MLKLVKYLRGYTKESILAPLFKLLEASFELLYCPGKHSLYCKDGGGTSGIGHRWALQCYYGTIF